MKYIYTLIIFLFVGMLVTAQDKINVVSSASIFQDMAMNIGGDKIATFSIVPIGGDPHLYDPKPSDAQLVKSADIILVNSNPQDILNLILFGKATYNKMIQKLVWATAYNIVAIPLAASVLYSGFVLGSAVGAELMSMSTIVVAINAQLLKTKLAW